jgi:hypothetical protein
MARATILRVFRYSLRLPDGEPADPAVVVTAVPNWELDEMFQTGDGSRWRLLAIETAIDEAFEAQGINAIWTVEPI